MITKVPCIAQGSRMHKLLLIVITRWTNVVCLFEASIKMVLAEEMFLPLQIILSCFPQIFYAMTKKLPIKKALNLSFHLPFPTKCSRIHSSLESGR